VSEPGPRPTRSAGLVLLIDLPAVQPPDVPAAVPLARSPRRQRPTQRLPPLSPQTERPKSRRLRASLDAATFAAGRGTPAAWRWASAGGDDARRVALSPKMLAAAIRATSLAAPGPGQHLAAPPLPARTA
jgi:hypothetical protein